jgi:hypothetical protein
MPNGFQVRKVFFFEKKNQKTFAHIDSESDPAAGARLRSPGEKVFWFFFSKKNIFLPFTPPPA